MIEHLKWWIAGKELTALHRYRQAAHLAHRWCVGERNASETADWIRQVGEGQRCADIEFFREQLRAAQAQAKEGAE